MLAKYGGMVYGESDARIDAKIDPQRAVMRVYEIPSNGREVVTRDDFVILPGNGTASDNGWRRLERRSTPRGPDD